MAARRKEDKQQFISATMVSGLRRIKLLYKLDTIVAEMNRYVYSQAIQDKGQQPHGYFTRITCFYYANVM